MVFTFNATKTAQAARRILLHHPDGLTYGEVVKLLYLVDRESLVRRGHPLTGDRMVSMDHGPVLSRTYDLIKDEDPDPEAVDEWHKCVSPRQGLNIRAVTDTRADMFGELSDWELDLIDEVDKEYAHLRFSGLRQLGHGLPEWHDPSGSSLPIEPEEILRSEGWSRDEIADAKEDAQAAQAWADMLPPA